VNKELTLICLAQVTEKEALKRNTTIAMLEHNLLLG
jgi:hypothetical protein